MSLVVTTMTRWATTTTRTQSLTINLPENLQAIKVRFMCWWKVLTLVKLHWFPALEGAVISTPTNTWVARRIPRKRAVPNKACHFLNWLKKFFFWQPAAFSCVSKQQKRRILRIKIVLKSSERQTRLSASTSRLTYPPYCIACWRRKLATLPF